MNKFLITFVAIIALTSVPRLVRGEHAIVCSGQQALFCDDFESGLNPLWTQTSPSVWHEAGGIVSAFLSGNQIGCSLIAQDTTWTNYTLQFDVRGNSGVDKMVGFRLHNEGVYVFSIRSDWSGDEAFLHVPGHDYAQIVPFPSQNGVWYHVEISCQQAHIVIQVDGTQIIDYVDANNSCPSGGIFLHCYTGMAGICDVSFDNVVVTEHPAVPGDADGSGIITISDAVYIIAYIFSGGPAPTPLLSGDAECNCIITISDAVYLINYIFAGGAAPCAACP